MRKKKVKVLLWLDDVRNPLEDDWMNFSPIGKDVEVVWVKSYNEFVSWIIEHGLPDGICFDHDLGEEGEYSLSGYDCASWLCGYCIDNKIKKLPKYSIQSANPVGKENIDSILKSYNKIFGK